MERELICLYADRFKFFLWSFLMDNRYVLLYMHLYIIRVRKILYVGAFLIWNFTNGISFINPSVESVSSFRQVFLLLREFLIESFCSISAGRVYGRGQCSFCAAID